MRQPPIYTTWKITCRSPEEAQALRQWLASRIDLNRVMTDTVRVQPGGVEQVQNVPHRLGDYFADIRTLTDPENETASFRLVFHRRPDADRFWKDLMVNLLQETEATPQTPKVSVESKTDTAPTSQERVSKKSEGMYILDFLRQMNRRGSTDDHPNQLTCEGESVTQVEYRLICSGAFHPIDFQGDCTRSDRARILLKWPVDLLIASRPYDDYPQELALRFTAASVTTQSEGMSRHFIPDEEIADDFAALLTLFCRRLVTVSGRIRQVFVSPGPPGPFPPTPSVLLDYPGPVATKLKVSHWASRPIQFFYGRDGVEVQSLQVPIKGFDSVWVRDTLAKLPDCGFAPAVIRAARLYQLAMEQIEHHYEISYQLLISAVETMAGAADLNWKPELKDKLELSSSRALLSLARKEGLSDESAERLVLEACKDYGWASRKFKEFIIENLRSEELEMEDDLFSVPAQFCPKPEKLRKALGVIYEARSGATHSGRSFPSTAAIGPSHLIPVKAVGDLMNQGAVFPPVCWFERVVHSAICSYVRRKVNNDCDFVT